MNKSCVKCGHSEEFHRSKKSDLVKWKDGYCSHKDCIISYVKKTSKCKKFQPQSVSEVCAKCGLSESQHYLFGTKCKKFQLQNQKGCGKEVKGAGLDCGEVYDDGRVQLCPACQNQSPQVDVPLTLKEYCDREEPSNQSLQVNASTVFN